MFAARNDRICRLRARFDHRIARFAAVSALAACALLAAAAGGHAQLRSASTTGARAAFARATASLLAESARLPRLRCVLVAHRGTTVTERCHRGPGPDTPVNIKSVSKSVISALVGIAIAEGKLSGVEQPIGPFFARYLDRDHELRKRAITIEDLLTMRSGLERTSGQAYGRWIASKDWVGSALARPLLYEPGTQMLYSTGNTHLLSAILTKATRQTTLRYAQQKLARPLGIRLDPWRRDPQGIYLGGNQMRLSPRALLRFGELYRNGGRYQGKQVVPADWIEASTQPRTRSPFSGQLYGYGWFVSELRGHRLFYAWGHGGQFIFVVPDLELTVVTTSDPSGPRDFEHLGGIYEGVLERMIELFEPAGPS